jgi:hypothetical protein
MEFDFEKNNTVTDVNTVPEKYRGIYSESQNDEGETVYVVADNVKPLVADYLGTAKALAGARNDKSTASNESAERRKALKAFDDVIEELGLEIGDDGAPTAIKAYVTDLQKKVKNGEEVSVNLEKIKREFDTRLDAALSEKDKEIQERDGALEKHLVSDAASRALADAKGSIELLLPHVRSQCKVVRNDDGSYSVRVKDAQGDDRMNSSGGWMGVAELVSEMKTQDSFARAFDSEVPAGTGAAPGSMSATTHRKVDRELSPNEKIGVGLRKKQYNEGSGTAERT